MGVAGRKAVACRPLNLASQYPIQADLAPLPPIRCAPHISLGISLYRAWYARTRPSSPGSSRCVGPPRPPSVWSSPAPRRPALATAAARQSSSSRQVSIFRASSLAAVRRCFRPLLRPARAPHLPLPSTPPVALQLCCTRSCLAGAGVPNHVRAVRFPRPFSLNHPRGRACRPGGRAHRCTG